MSHAVLPSCTGNVGNRGGSEVITWFHRMVFTRCYIWISLISVGLDLEVQQALWSVHTEGRFFFAMNAYLSLWFRHIKFLLSWKVFFLFYWISNISFDVFFDAILYVPTHDNAINNKIEDFHLKWIKFYLKLFQNCLHLCCNIPWSYYNIEKHTHRPVKIMVKQNWLWRIRKIHFLRVNYYFMSNILCVCI